MESIGTKLSLLLSDNYRVPEFGTARNRPEPNRVDTYQSDPKSSGGFRRIAGRFRILEPCNLLSISRLTLSLGSGSGIFKNIPL